jgi:hypothetical protein
MTYPNVTDLCHYVAKKKWMKINNNNNNNNSNNHSSFTPQYMAPVFLFATYGANHFNIIPPSIKITD